MAETKEKRASSQGKCELCGGVFAKNVMSKHLQKCPERVKGSGTTKLLHLLVEGQDLPQYWMHLEISEEASLYDLDQFLRDTWLECCGHMSEFNIAGEVYESRGMGEWRVAGEGADLEDEDEDEADEEELGMIQGDLFGPLRKLKEALIEGEEQQGMNVRTGEVLSPGKKFFYEYDFGTTTYLALKVIGVSEGSAPEKPVTLLVRNDPPEIACESCGKPATVVCGACMNMGEKAWYCKKCSGKHKCDSEGERFLKVVNSPRVGQCGYGG